MTQVNVVILNREDLIKVLETSCIAGSVEEWLEQNEQKSPVLAYASTKQLSEELTKRNVKHEVANEPYLGLATTKELLEELKTRAKTGGYLNEKYSKETFASNREIGDMLECLIFHADENGYDSYKTVDS